MERQERDRCMCKATVATSVAYTVEEARAECSGALALGHQTDRRGSGVSVKSIGTL